MSFKSGFFVVSEADLGEQMEGVSNAAEAASRIQSR